MKKESKKPANCRLNQVGGQAVIEGVMMKHKNKCSLAIRMPDNSIKIKNYGMNSVRQKHKILNIPILRGVINFVEMLMLSMKTLNFSTDALGLDEMEETKFEKWLSRKFGKKLMDVLMVFAMIIGVAMALFLFFFLPSFLTKTIDWLAGDVLGGWKTVIEGAMKILIFILYLYLTSLMSDIKRTYQYHGAEHKTVFAYEAGVELTPENVRKFKRYHPRCGTSFIFVMLLLSIIIGAALPWSNAILRTTLKILIMPLSVGLGFEFIMFAGKHSNNIIVKILAAPGLWMQRITTREPDDSQLEIAICALKCAMAHEYPDFHPDAEIENEDESDAPAPAETDEQK